MQDDGEEHLGSDASGSTGDLVSVAIASSFLGRLAQPIIDAIRQGAILHHVAAGQVFIEEAEPDWLGIVVSGITRVYLELPDRHEVTVRYVRSGGAVGVAALAGVQHPVVVQSITACQILQLDLVTVRAVVESEPDAGRAVARELAARLFDTYGELVTQVRGTVRQRLAGHLLAVIDLNADDKSAGRPLTVSRTHEELAETIGSAREVVSKALSSFAREGILHLGRGKIRVLDPVQLHRIASSPFSRTEGRPI